MNDFGYPPILEILPEMKLWQPFYAKNCNEGESDIFSVVMFKWIKWKVFDSTFDLCIEFADRLDGILDERQDYKRIVIGRHETFSLLCIPLYHGHFS